MKTLQNHLMTLPEADWLVLMSKDDRSSSVWESNTYNRIVRILSKQPQADWSRCILLDTMTAYRSSILVRPDTQTAGIASAIEQLLAYHDQAEGMIKQIEHSLCSMEK